MTDQIDPSAISKKVLLNKSLTFKNGELAIWNIRGMIFSCYSLIFLFKSLDKMNCQKGLDAIYWMGFYQGFGATTVTQKRFGIKSKVLENVVGQGEILGYGKTLINVANFDKCYFVFEVQSTLAKEYLMVYGGSKTAVCHHFRGLFAGTIFALTGKEVICVEESCIGNMKKFCLFTVKEKSKWDLKKIKDQIPMKFPNPQELGDHTVETILKQKNSH